MVRGWILEIPYEQWKHAGENRSGRPQIGADGGVDHHYRIKHPGAPASLEGVIRAAFPAMPTLRAPDGKPNLFFFLNYSKIYVT